ncbi:MAG: hypothetical protein JW854_00480 [Actinobacteria bacterium]|nr:hypothetical protein [Actinomycetota bacterium]
MERRPARETDLLKLVDRYKAMLDDIARYKMRGAALGGSPAARRKMKHELDTKTREAEELEREIDELRARIMAREAEIRKLGKRELP